MNNLHKVIYQIVSNPNILTDFTQNSQKFMNKFDLSHNEMVSLKSVLVNHGTLQQLTSPETIKQATKSAMMSAWIIPNSYSK